MNLLREHIRQTTPTAPEPWSPADTFTVVVVVVALLLLAWL